MLLLRLLSLLCALLLCAALTAVGPEEHVHRALTTWPHDQWLLNGTIAVQTVASSQFARCQVHTLRLPTGAIVDNWVFFDERPHVNVLVRLKADRRFVVFRQRKYALGAAESLAPVGGFIEDGESPAAAARRELSEELGLRSTSWRSLGSYTTSANRGGGQIHAFFADDCVALERGGHTPHGDLERQRTVRLSLSELRAELLGGRFAEVKWTATVALSLLSLDPYE
jgi:8-oxo-dGTP pyrophosphatase MutT (NUDIX family)